MPTRRKKSYNEIRNQMGRIIERELSRNNGEWTLRAYNANNAGHRYMDNLMRNRGSESRVVTPLGNAYTRRYIDADKKYSQSAYMGNSAG